MERLRHGDPASDKSERGCLTSSESRKLKSPMSLPQPQTARSSEEASSPEPHAALLPATVKSVAHGRVWLEVEGRAPFSALVAVPAPYAPRTGDSVLVAPGQGDFKP